MKNKLLLICQHFYPEMVSTGLHMTELATYINNHYDDVEIEVLCSHPSKNTFTDKDLPSVYKNVNIIRKKSNGKEHGGVLSRLVFGVSFFLRVFFFLISNHKKYKGFIITTNPPFLGLATIFLKKIFSKPYFLIVYDVYPDIAVKLGLLSKNSLITKCWSFVTTSILKNAAAFSVIGRDMEKIILNKADGLNNKSVLIYNWSDAEHVKPIPKEENLFLQQHPQLKDKYLFVYSGNMGRTHNMHDILALAKECKTEKDYHFLIIGGGAKFEEVKTQSTGEENITVLPYQPFEILPHVLSASTYCLVCLEKEFTGYSVPSKTYSVMAASKPIIAFLAKDSEIGLAVEEAHCGFVIEDSKSASSLKEEIKASIASGRVGEMGNNALIFFRENYTLEISAGKYYEAFMRHLLHSSSK